MQATALDVENRERDKTQSIRKGLPEESPIKNELQIGCAWCHEKDVYRAKWVEMQYPEVAVHSFTSGSPDAVE